MRKAEDHWHRIRPKRGNPGKYEKEDQHLKPGEEVECDKKELRSVFDQVFDDLQRIDDYLDRLFNDAERWRKENRLPFTPSTPLIPPIPVLP